MVGLYGRPTTVNNVETIAVAPTILRRGAAWFAGFGRPNNTGTKIYCISGHVNQPCVVEDEMGIPLRTLIDKHCGGVRGGWDNLLAVIPGGASVPLMPEVDLRHGADGLRQPARGTERPRHRRRDRDGQVHRHREGDRPAVEVLHARVLRPVHAVPRGHRLAVADDDRGWPRAGPRSRRSTCCYDVTKEIEGHTICALGDAAAWPVQGLIRHFRPEIERRIDDYTQETRRAA